MSRRKRIRRDNCLVGWRGAALQTISSLNWGVEDKDGQEEGGGVGLGVGRGRTSGTSGHGPGPDVSQATIN